MTPPTTRRNVLKTAAAVSGALVLGFRIPLTRSASQVDAAQDEVFAPNAFIRIRLGEPITLVMPQAEMGQGIHTAHAMIIAEELDADLRDLTITAAPPSDTLYGNPIFQIQVTGNSNSIRAFWLPLRKVGASARALLVTAAANEWGVDPSSCRTESGFVIHATTNRRRAYNTLAAQAARLPAPENVPLKALKDFRLVGRTQRRLDTPDKVNGKLRYGMDAMPPGVQFAVLAACPVFGGSVKHVDIAPALRVAGVRKVVVLNDLVAVVADHTWAAKQGLAALAIEWHTRTGVGVDTAELSRRLAQASESPGALVAERGRVDEQLAAHRRLDATYQLPLLAHATMEPMNCTVHVQPQSCEIWVGTQVQARSQAAAMQITGLPAERVIVHNHSLGCGLGRRLEVDVIEKAVRIAQRVEGPVKVIWTREEDIQHDLYRPAYYDRLSAAWQDGRIVAWSHRITGSAVFARWFPPIYTHNIDIDAVDSAVDIPYALPNFRLQFVREEPATVPTGFWRGVGPNHNVFSIESFIDEIAFHMPEDPVALRLRMLGKLPRLKAALELAAGKIGWGEPLPPRVGRGVAIQPSFASFIATIIEVEVDQEGVVHLRRVVTAVDTGIVINPDTVVAQLQGGLVVGLTAAMFGQITVRDGRVLESNFHDYRMLRMNEMPTIEVHLIPSTEAPGGIGEAGATAAPAALCNAIFSATGKRIRTLPVMNTALA